MLRIDPRQFTGPRAYFTNFDNWIIKGQNDLPLFRKEIERKLKVLILTKSNIVCAGAHLTSEFVYEIFRDNPVLLAREIIIPAFEESRIQTSEDIAKLFVKKEYKTSGKKEEIIGFFKENIQSGVKWQLEDNSGWFKNTFLSELENPSSVIRKNLTGIDSKILERIITKIKENDEKEFSRQLIEQLISDVPVFEHKKIIKNYRELVYHFSGARVVCCESSLPQENYLDYSLADFENRQTKLSEVQIFWKIFIELAFDTMKFQSLPIELLDRLSFDRVVQIRDMIDQTSFKQQYELLIDKAVQSVNADESELVVYNLEELNNIRQKISDNFSEVFKSELGSYLKKQTYKDTKGLLDSGVSVGLGLAGMMVPGLSFATGLIGLAKDSRQLFMNANQNINNFTELAEMKSYAQSKEKFAKSIIEKSDITDKSLCLDMVTMLSKSITQTIDFSIK